MELKVNTNHSVKFELIEQSEFEIDDRFRRCKIYIAHENLNLNNSVFPKPTLEYMGKYLEGVGIVGYVDINKFDESDFRGHEMKLVKNEDGFSFNYLCVPFGVVLKDNKAQIEMLDLDNSGIEKAWLTCEGVLYNRFKKCIDIFERDDNVKNQSMELSNSSVKGKFNDENQFVFDEAKIEFLTILGSDIRPAMEGSNVTMFSNNDFQLSFKSMLDDINDSVKQFSLETNKEQIKEVITMLKEVIEPVVEPIVEQPIEKFEAIEETAPVVEEPIVEPVVEEFATIITEIKEEHKLEINTVIIEEISDDSSEPVEDFAKEDKAKEEEVVIKDEEVKKEEVPKKKYSDEEYESLQSKFEALEVDFGKKIVEFESLETEVVGLKEYKITKEKEELKYSVDCKIGEFTLTEDEVKDLKAKAYSGEISVESLENGLFAIVGKKNFTANKIVEAPAKVMFSLQEEVKDECAYSGIAHLFKK